MKEFNELWIYCVFEGNPPKGYKDWQQFINSKVKYGVKIAAVNKEKDMTVDEVRQEAQKLYETCLEIKKENDKLRKILEEKDKQINRLQDLLSLKEAQEQDVEKFRKVLIEYNEKVLAEYKQQTKFTKDIAESLYYLLKTVQERL